MAKWKEIEIKWNASKVSRKSFNDEMRSFLKRRTWSLISPTGYDYYYSKGSRVLRHRHGRYSNELTSKSRTSEKSITVRKELNVRLHPKTSPLDVREMARDLGFTKTVSIYKDCDIYTFLDDGHFIDVVWYRASKGRMSLDLIEVEVHDAPVKKSFKILKKWRRFMRDSFGLTREDVVRDSLYEIFTGCRYRMSS